MVNKQSGYHIPGELALWKGDVSKVKQYSSKCAKLASQITHELIIKFPERAVRKAQGYYQKFLKWNYSVSSG